MIDCFDVANVGYGVGGTTGGNVEQTVVPDVGGSDVGGGKPGGKVGIKVGGTQQLPSPGGKKGGKIGDTKGVKVGVGRIFGGLNFGRMDDRKGQKGSQGAMPERE
jgi:hypothetical protein